MKHTGIISEEDITINVVSSFLFTNILKQERLCYTTNLKIMKNSRTCLELSSMETGYAAEKQDTAGIYQEQEITT